jgi:hypothetical protein
LNNTATHVEGQKEAPEARLSNQQKLLEEAEEIKKDFSIDALKEKKAAELQRVVDALSARVKGLENNDQEPVKSDNKYISQKEFDLHKDLIKKHATEIFATRFVVWQEEKPKSMFKKKTK